MKRRLRHTKLALQIRDPLRRGRIDVIMGDVALNRLILPDKGNRRHPRLAADLVAYRKRHQRDELRLFADPDRNPVEGNPLVLISGFLQSGGERDFQILAKQKEDVKRRGAGRNLHDTGAVAEAVTKLIVLIHHDAGRHDLLKHLDVQLARLVFADLTRLARNLARQIEMRLDILQRIGNRRMLRLPPRAVVNEDLLVSAVGAEDIAVVADRLRLAEKKIAAVLQRDMKDREQILLQHGLEVNQQVPAADQIQTAEGRILKDVVLGEDDHRADLMIYHILGAPAREIPAEPADAHILDDVLPVDALAGKLHRVRVQIGRKDLDIPPDVELLHHLGEQNRQRIGFLAGGAARAPDADLFRGLAFLHDLRDDPRLQHLEIIRIPEEGSDADQDLFCQRPGLLLIALQIIHVALQIAAVRDHDPPLDPAENRRLLIIRVVGVRDVFQDREHLGDQIIVRQHHLAVGGMDGLRDVRHLLGDGVRTQDQIHEPGGDGVLRHAVELGRIRILDDDQMARFSYASASDRKKISIG